MSVEPRKIFYTIGDLVMETGIQQRHINLLLERHGDEIPSLMDGDRRRYTSETVPVLSRLWREYKKGLKEDEVQSEWYGAALDKLRDSGGKLSEVAKALRSVHAELRDHPPHRIFYINTFPGGDLQPTRAIAVHVDIQGTRSRATLIEGDLEAYGDSDKAAVLLLREVIMRTFLRLEQGRTQEEEEAFSVLSSLIRRKRSACKLPSSRGAGMSTYLLILRRNQAEPLTVPQEEMLVRFQRFTESLREKGVLRSFERLKPSVQGATAREDGGVINLEGPYDRSQEGVIGFYLIEVADQEAAHAIAKECPILTVGGSVEIRETEFFP